MRSERRLILIHPLQLETTIPASPQSTIARRGALHPIVAGAIVAATAGAIGWSGEKFSPAPTHPKTRRWYNRLHKPGFTPPGAVFALGWSAIELALGYGGYRLMRRPASDKRNLALGLWGLNSALIAAWSPLFFGKKATGASALAAGGMMVAAAGYGAASVRTDKMAAATAIPLLSWIGFATLLAEEIWRRNSPDAAHFRS